MSKYHYSQLSALLCLKQQQLCCFAAVTNKRIPVGTYLYLGYNSGANNQIVEDQPGKRHAHKIAPPYLFEELRRGPGHLTLALAPASNGGSSPYGGSHEKKLCVPCSRQSFEQWVLSFEF